MLIWLPGMMCHEILVTDITKCIKISKENLFHDQGNGIIFNLQFALLDLISDFLDPFSIFLVKRI